MWTGGVRRVQSKCWPDTGERLDPIVVYRCGGTDKQKDLYKSHTPKTIVRSWSGSGSRWGSKSPKTVDRVERYFQQRWIESTLGEDGGNVGFRKSCKYTWMGRSLSKGTVLPTWVERYVGLTVRQSQKGKTFGVWLGRWRGCSVKKGKGNFLYNAISIPQRNVSTNKISPCNLCCAAPFGT